MKHLLVAALPLATLGGGCATENGATPPPASSVAPHVVTLSLANGAFLPADAPFDRTL